jgi:hypothetical protein
MYFTKIKRCHVATAQTLSSNSDLGKNLTSSWVLWFTPVVPATQKAEAGGLFEPRNSGPAWAT